MKQFDIYTELKNEDRKFGEKSNKASPKDHQKRTKHVAQQDFSRMNPRDIVAMGQDDLDYADEDQYAMA